jgi:hypothetical protein
VGDRVWHSPRWKTFHDFLDEHLIQRLGLKWFSTETAKPVDQRHRIVRWREDAVAELEHAGVSVGGVSTGIMTGVQRAYLNLAYNVYLIAHHAPAGQCDNLLETFLIRLRSERSDDFTGKLFETYAAAAFLKAGFQLDYEDETVGGTSHVEFTATYPATGKKFSVEVKSRNRAAGDVAEVEEFRRLRVNTKLMKALQKKAAHTHVVMIEINVPDVLTGESLDGWPGAALEQIRQAEKNEVAGGAARALPPAYVLVTNHAFHNNLAITAVATQVLAVGFKIPDFGPDVEVPGLAALLASKERHKEMFALIESMRTHYEIPSTFDGGNPVQSFAEPSDVPRLRFGAWYEIPLPDGGIVGGRLYEAVVMENEKSVFGAYMTGDGKHVFATCPMSASELAAWRRHPETYFGEVRQINRPVENWLEMALFFHETYKQQSAATVSQTDSAEHSRSRSASSASARASAPSSPTMMAIRAEASAKIVTGRLKDLRRMPCLLPCQCGAAARAWRAVGQIVRAAAPTRTPGPAPPARPVSPHPVSRYHAAWRVGTPGRSWTRPRYEAACPLHRTLS